VIVILVFLKINNKTEDKYSITIDVYSLNYLNHLDQKVYNQFTNTKIYAYLNISLSHHKGKEVSYYQLRTKIYPLYTTLHSLWYKWNNDENRFIKIIPLNIFDIF